MSTKRIAGPEIERLIQLLAKVPGLGPRSARRAALHLIKKKEQLLSPLADAMSEAVDKVCICSVCGNVDTADPCMICTDARRDGAIIIVVEDVADLWALERAGSMNARFHVLGGTLSPLVGIGPEQLYIWTLIVRVARQLFRREDDRRGIGRRSHPSRQIRKDAFRDRETLRRACRRGAGDLGPRVRFRRGEDPL